MLAAMSFAIRPCRLEDAPALQEIEWSAGQRFREVGMDDVAAHGPAPVEVLAPYATGGRSWVAVTEAGEVVGYVLVDVVDGNAHIEQISVRPDHQGAGVGRALIERVRSWARDRGMSAITLTTFVAVSWNGPWYRHLGFRALAGDDIGPQLRAVQEAEAAHGLDRPPGSACASTSDSACEKAPRLRRRIVRRVQQRRREMCLVRLRALPDRSGVTPGTWSLAPHYTAGATVRFTDDRAGTTGPVAARCCSRHG